MKKRFTVLGLVLVLAGTAGWALAGGSKSSKVAYPEGYRQWTHVKSMVIQKGHPLENPFQGIHHIYANPKAEKGYQSGKFAKGSVLVFDLLNSQSGGSALVEGARKLVGVMVKDDQKYKNTGGWGFEGFAGDSSTKRLVQDGGVGCYQCHTAKKNNDFVFSGFRK